MCGISGYIDFKKERDLDQIIRKMNETIFHRGPDNEGVFIENGVGLGHRRLSIIDLSSAGNQPFQKHELTLVFNGEIYNYIELRDELRNLGYQFSTETDTEVLISAYFHWGEKCLNKFNGMWAFSIYDPANNIVFCSRDRFGIKPFCYYSDDERLIFGSEEKQILQVWEKRPRLNLNTAASFLFLGELNVSEETFIENILHLPAGHNLSINLTDKSIKLSKWYSLTKSSYDTVVHGSDVTEKFGELLEQSVNLRLRSDIEVGSCLSGGMDSSSIVAMAQKNQPQALKTITSCYKNLEYDEQEYADLVTQKVGSKSLKIYPDLNSLINDKIWEKIIYHQDQPILSFSHFSEYSVFEFAKNEGLIVMLDGQGSDEFLCGYNSFIGEYFNILIRNRKYFSAVKFIWDRSKLIDTSFTKLLWTRIKSLNRPNNTDTPLEQSYASPRSLELIESRSQQVFNNLNEFCSDQIFRSSLPFQLHSEDRNSMLWSVESRLPFLDFKLLEFAFHLPYSYKLDKGRTKAILRDSVQDLLPKVVINRHIKMGFAAPDETYFREFSIFTILFEISTSLYPDLRIIFSMDFKFPNP